MRLITTYQHAGPYLLSRFPKINAIHAIMPNAPFIYFATAALKTCVLKKPPFVLSMTC